MRKFLRKTLVPLVLSAIFFLIVSPVAFVFRILRRDPMRREFDDTSASYRTAADATSREGLERPY
jgi:hypothetical protein